MNKMPLHYGMIGESSPFLKMVAAIKKIAAYDATVLISGETGCGKELAARAIHYLSTRFGKPFIPVNCGAIPDHLIENELFGHNRGAYTDARDAQPGLIAQAEGGTLFLDEIDALTHKAQICLLRFLQDGQYRPLGSSRMISANVRIIAATNADIENCIKEGGFRSDLHYRINFMELPVPPLRERGEDIILLAQYFIGEAAKHYNLPPKTLHPDTIRWLCSQNWPGNIRELQHCIQREFLLTDGLAIHIQPRHLPTDRRRRLDRRLAFSDNLNFNEAKQHALNAFEKKHLQNLMQLSTGNVSHAARLAGKERRALGKLLKKHQIDPRHFKASSFVGH